MLHICCIHKHLVCCTDTHLVCCIYAAYTRTKTPNFFGGGYGRTPTSENSLPTNSNETNSMKIIGSILFAVVATQNVTTSAALRGLQPEGNGNNREYDDANLPVFLIANQYCVY